METHGICELGWGRREQRGEDPDMRTFDKVEASGLIPGAVGGLWRRVLMLGVELMTYLWGWGLEAFR